MFRRLRIAVLLIVLGFVALGALADRLRTASWEQPLWVGVFPVNADGRAATEAYIESLAVGQFADIEQFFAREAAAFALPLAAPVAVKLYPPVAERPPQLEPGAGVLARIGWSLRARYYSWRIGRDRPADIRVFVLYHDPAHTGTVPHSTGLQQGLLGIVHAYADGRADGSNNLVIAHELLHTLGATDKYDPATNLPRFPEGYADPAARPRHPQPAAEIMAGRIALSPGEAAMPADLDDAVVGRQTALEVHWLDD